MLNKETIGAFVAKSAADAIIFFAIVIFVLYGCDKRVSFSVDIKSGKDGEVSAPRMDPAPLIGPVENPEAKK